MSPITCDTALLREHPLVTALLAPSVRNCESQGFVAVQQCFCRPWSCSGKVVVSVTSYLPERLP